MNRWLMKSELDVYPYSQLVADGWTHWDGVRNYQARNMMRDDMKVGDLVLFYHSNTKPPHVAGVARVTREIRRFHILGRLSKYFDEKSTADNPRWFMVDIEPVCELTMVPSRHEGQPKSGRDAASTTWAAPLGSTSN